MRIDFREERKWKMAVAYTLAHDAVEWHEAGTKEERVNRGICILWQPPSASRFEEEEMALDGSAVEVDEEDREAQLVYPSEEQSDDEERLDGEKSRSTPSPVELLEERAPKVEDVEDINALQDKANLNLEQPVLTDTKEEEAPPNALVGLRLGSTDPLIAETATANAKPQSNVAASARLRARIAYSREDMLFIDDDDLGLIQKLSDMTTDDKKPDNFPVALDLQASFPELQPFDFLDIAPATPQPAPEGKKKSDRKSDKDDPYKRSEDTTYARLVPVSQFMYVKPTLVGPLQPSKHWVDGHWHDLDETPVSADQDFPLAKPAEDNPCCE
jgi:chromatin modification-related protein VID21